MSTAREIAAEVLPHFAAAVLARKQHTYGYYARMIGRDAAKESMIIGPAMHLIGALCIIRQIPVAPLFWVKRSDDETREVFASDSIEAEYVLPHRETLYVVSREYTYSQADFDAIVRPLQKMIEEKDKYPPDWSPHFMWQQLVLKGPNDSTQTYFARALLRYDALLKGLRGK